MSEPPSLAAGAEGPALAELLALISALAETPLRQDLAVLGSVGPSGAVGPVADVNGRIEAFFGACAARGLSGAQGVIIPDANRQQLMLGEDVVDAVREGRFRVYAVKTVDDALGLLADREIGARDGSGRSGPETLRARVEAKLKTFSETMRGFAAGKDSPVALQEKGA